MRDESKPLPKLPPTGYTVLLLEGSHVTDFGKKIFDLSNYPSACLTNAPVSVYHLIEKQLVVFLCDDVQLEFASRCAEMIAPWLLKASQVVTISVLSNAEHKASDNNDSDKPCFARSIRENSLGVRTLELPNLISGVSAGVATWLVCQKMTPANSLVFYVDKPKLDTMNGQPIIDMIRKIGISCSPQYVPSMVDYSNLYC